MKTRKNKLFNFLKFGILFFGITVLLWNCKKEDFESNVEISKSSFAQKFVTLSDIPKVKQFLPQKLKNIYQSKTITENEAIFDEGNILEVIDTLNNANYSFSFIVPTAPKGQFFNLIISKNKYGEMQTPFILKYTCDKASVDEFVANNHNINYFRGTISLHKYTDYFEKNYFSKTTNHDCTEFDQFGDPIPCDINPVDGTSTGGGSGVDLGGSGTGTTSGNPTGGGGSCSSTYSWWCAAGGTGPHSVESCGAGTGGILIIDISCAFQNKSTTDCPPCATSIDGGIGILPNLCKNGGIKDINGNCVNDWPEDVMLFDNISDPIIPDITEYLKCFDLTKNATVTLYVDQPKANESDTWSGFPTDPNVGHTFISITQGGITRVMGLYPDTSVNPFSSNPSTNGQLVDNAGHDFDVSASVNISSSQLTNLYNGILSSHASYNLNTFNCTDFGIKMGNLLSMGIPDTNGTWPGGGGSNPGNLGQDIRNMSLKNGVTRNSTGGKAVLKSGTCP